MRHKKKPFQLVKSIHAALSHIRDSTEDMMPRKEMLDKIAHIYKRNTYLAAGDTIETISNDTYDIFRQTLIPEQDLVSLLESYATAGRQIKGKTSYNMVEGSDLFEAAVSTVQAFTILPASSVNSGQSILSAVDLLNHTLTLAIPGTKSIYDITKKIDSYIEQFYKNNQDITYGKEILSILADHNQLNTAQTLLENAIGFASNPYFRTLSITEGIVILEKVSESNYFGTRKEIVKDATIILDYIRENKFYWEDVLDIFDSLEYSESHESRMRYLDEIITFSKLAGTNIDTIATGAVSLRQDTDMTAHEIYTTLKTVIFKDYSSMIYGMLLEKKPNNQYGDIKNCSDSIARFAFNNLYSVSEVSKIIDTYCKSENIFGVSEEFEKHMVATYLPRIQEMFRSQSLTEGTGNFENLTLKATRLVIQNGASFKDVEESVRKEGFAIGTSDMYDRIEKTVYGKFSMNSGMIPAF